MTSYLSLQEIAPVIREEVAQRVAAAREVHSPNTKPCTYHCRLV